MIDMIRTMQFYTAPIAFAILFGILIANIVISVRAFGLFEAGAAIAGISVLSFAVLTPLVSIAIIALLVFLWVIFAPLSRIGNGLIAIGGVIVLAPNAGAINMFTIANHRPIALLLSINRIVLITLSSGIAATVFANSIKTVKHTVLMREVIGINRQIAFTDRACFANALSWIRRVVVSPLLRISGATSFAIGTEAVFSGVFTKILRGYGEVLTATSTTLMGVHSVSLSLSHKVKQSGRMSGGFSFRRTRLLPLIIPQKEVFVS